VAERPFSAAETFDVLTWEFSDISRELGNAPQRWHWLAGLAGFELANPETCLEHRHEKPIAAELLKCTVTKDWTSAANEASVFVTLGGPLSPSGISPRWPCGHRGASAVTVPDAVATKGSQNVATQNCKQGKIRARPRRSQDRQGSQRWIWLAPPRS
jgi:hypothetical protein